MVAWKGEKEKKKIDKKIVIDKTHAFTINICNHGTQVVEQGTRVTYTFICHDG